MWCILALKDMTSGGNDLKDLLYSPGAQGGPVCNHMSPDFDS